MLNYHILYLFLTIPLAPSKGWIKNAEIFNIDFGYFNLQQLTTICWFDYGVMYHQTIILHEPVACKLNFSLMELKFV